MTGVTVDFPLDAGIRRVFGEVLIAGSAYRVRSAGIEAGQGYGIAGKAGISPLGFDCSLQWYKGHDLLMPVGDPVYRTNESRFCRFEIRQELFDKRPCIGNRRFTV